MKDERDLDADGGAVALAEKPSAPRQSTVAWAIGADGERRLGAYLEACLGDVGVVLHDRRIPGTRANIDHVVIAPSGVWVIDAKNWSGTVRHRPSASEHQPAGTLVVGRWNRTDAIDKLVRQAEVVRTALQPIGFHDMPIFPCLCLTTWGAAEGWSPFVMTPVLVTWPEALGCLVGEPGAFGPGSISTVAHTLSERLPPSA